MWPDASASFTYNITTTSSFLKNNFIIKPQNQPDSFISSILQHLPCLVGFLPPLVFPSIPWFFKTFVMSIHVWHVRLSKYICIFVAMC